MIAVFDYVPDFGNVFVFHDRQIVFIGLDMNKKGHGQKVHHRRNKRNNNNGVIRNLRPLSHNKRARPHNRRHNLSAGGSSGFHTAGNMRRQADAFHQWNGHRAGTNGIRHRAAGNGSHQSAGKNGNLGRAALTLTQQSGGQIH